MSRVIKFRAWDEQDSKMVYDFVEAAGRKPSPYLDRVGVLVRSTWHTLMQFTGITDKNGKEIYEGDVIKGTIKPEHNDNIAGEEIRFIKFDHEYRFSACEGKYNHGLPINWGGYESIEVIGNIYENPELLNSK